MMHVLGFESTMRSWKGWSSCEGAIFGLTISFGAAAQHGGSSAKTPLGGVYI